MKLGKQGGSRWRWMLGLAVLLCAHQVCAQEPAPVPKATFGQAAHTMVPANSLLAVTVDLPWLWQAAEPLRAREDQFDLLNGIAKLTGVSLESDILPWVGETAFVMPAAGTPQPMAIMLQVRDKEAYTRCMKPLRGKVETALKVKWESTTYETVRVYRFSVPRQEGTPPVQLSLAALKDWLVLGIHAGSIEAIIDTQQGRTPALSAQPTWQQAREKLPTAPMVLCSMYGTPRLTAQDGKRSGQFGLGWNATERNWLGVYSLSDLGEGIALDGALMPTTEQAKASCVRLAKNTGIIKGDALAKLPASTVGALVVGNPHEWLTFLNDAALAGAKTEKERKSIAPLFAPLQPLREVLAPLTGECAVGMSFAPEQGFGVTVIGDAGTANKANSTAQAFKGLYTASHVSIVQEDDLYKMERVLSTNPPFRLQPCWKVEGAWFRFATWPEWLQGGPTSLKLPKEADGASLALVGKLGFLEQLLQQGGGDQSVITLIDSLKQAEVSAYLKIQPDGSSQTLHLEATHWEWRETLSALIGENGVFDNARRKARQSMALSNARQVVLAVTMHTQDNDDTMPRLQTAEDLKTFAAAMNLSPQVLINPMTGKAFLPNAYLAGRRLGEIANPSQMVVLYDPEPDARGYRVAAFLDGHVQIISAQQWPAVKQASKIP